MLPARVDTHRSWVKDFRLERYQIRCSLGAVSTDPKHFFSGGSIYGRNGSTEVVLPGQSLLNQPTLGPSTGHGMVVEFRT